MAKRNDALNRPAPSKNMPVIRRQLEIFSLPAQRVVERVLHPVNVSLAKLDTILLIIGEKKGLNVDQPIATIGKELEDVAKKINRAISQLEILERELRTENQFAIDYERPIEGEISIRSPQSAAFVHLVERLDHYAMLVDKLWFAGRMSGKDRMKEQWKWQSRMAGLGNRFIALEKRAWAAVRRTGHEAEAIAQVGPESELISEKDLGEDAPAPEAIEPKTTKSPKSTKSTVPAEAAE